MLICHSLQGRMADTNRNLTAKSLLLLGELAKAMGPAFEGVGRPLLSACMATLSDNKSQVRRRPISCTLNACRRNTSCIHIDGPDTAVPS